MAEAYNVYVSFRAEEEECDYSDYPGWFNNYGDYAGERPYDEQDDASRDVAYSQGWGFDIELLNEETAATLNEIYQKFRERGAEVYFSWAPINEQSDGNEDIYAAAEEFQARLKELFEPYDIKIISEVTDYIWPGRFFYDSDYHLNDLGAIYRTERLLADMRDAGLIDVEI